MSRSAGTGSPVWFRCWRERKGEYHPRDYATRLTGRTKPRGHRRGIIGTRNVHTLYEYECDCGYVGWSSHIDLAHRAGDEAALRRTGHR